MRSYIRSAEACGIVRDGADPSEEHWTALMAALQPSRVRERGDAWRRCLENRPRIECHVDSGLKLTRARALLKRDGIEIPYSTLHRFAREVLGFGRSTTTIPLLDGEPGQ